MMPISGTLLNAALVLLGGTLGLLVGGRLAERFGNIIMGGIGLAVVVIGLQMAFAIQNPLILVGSILFGGLLGETLRLQDRLDTLGNYLQKRLARQGKGRAEVDEAAEPSTFSEAFVSSSIVFCVGPLAILGAIQNGVNNDMTLLAVKSMLDGFVAFTFAATLGWGVLVSSVTVLVYQGLLSMLAFFMAGNLSDCSSLTNCQNPYILAMTAVGGLIVMGVGLRILNIKELKLANFIPALAVAPLIVWVVQQLTG